MSVRERRQLRYSSLKNREQQAHANHQHDGPTQTIIMHSPHFSINNTFIHDHRNSIAPNSQQQQQQQTTTSSLLPPKDNHNQHQQPYQIYQQQSNANNQTSFTQIQQQFQTTQHETIEVPLKPYANLSNKVKTQFSQRQPPIFPRTKSIDEDSQRGILQETSSNIIGNSTISQGDLPSSIEAQKSTIQTPAGQRIIWSIAKQQEYIPSQSSQQQSNQNDSHKKQSPQQQQQPPAPPSIPKSIIHSGRQRQNRLRQNSNQQQQQQQQQSTSLYFQPMPPPAIEPQYPYTQFQQHPYPPPPPQLLQSSTTHNNPQLSTMRKSSEQLETNSQLQLSIIYGKPRASTSLRRPQQTSIIPSAKPTSLSKERQSLSTGRQGHIQMKKQRERDFHSSTISGSRSSYGNHRIAPLQNFRSVSNECTQQYSNNNSNFNPSQYLVPPTQYLNRNRTSVSAQTSRIGGDSLTHLPKRTRDTSSIRSSGSLNKQSLRPVSQIPSTSSEISRSTRISRYQDQPTPTSTTSNNNHSYNYGPINKSTSLDSSNPLKNVIVHNSTTNTTPINGQDYRSNKYIFKRPQYNNQNNNQTSYRQTSSIVANSPLKHPQYSQTQRATAAAQVLQQEKNNETRTNSKEHMNSVGTNDFLDSYIGQLIQMDNLSTSTFDHLSTHVENKHLNQSMQSDEGNSNVIKNNNNIPTQNTVSPKQPISFSYRQSDQHSHNFKETIPQQKQMSSQQKQQKIEAEFPESIRLYSLDHDGFFQPSDYMESVNLGEDQRCFSPQNLSFNRNSVQFDQSILEYSPNNNNTTNKTSVNTNNNDEELRNSQLPQWNSINTESEDGTYDALPPVTILVPPSLHHRDCNKKVFQFDNQIPPPQLIPSLKNTTKSNNNNNKEYINPTSEHRAKVNTQVTFCESPKIIEQKSLLIVPASNQFKRNAKKTMQRNDILIQQTLNNGEIDEKTSSKLQNLKKQMQSQQADKKTLLPFGESISIDPDRPESTLSNQNLNIQIMQNNLGSCAPESSSTNNNKNNNNNNSGEANIESVDRINLVDVDDIHSNLAREDRESVLQDRTNSGEDQRHIVVKTNSQFEEMLNSSLNLYFQSSQDPYIYQSTQSFNVS